MSKIYKSRSMVFIAADFAPEFGPNLMSAMDKLYKRAKPPEAKLQAATGYSFKWPDERRVLMVNSTRITCQVLGFDNWGKVFTTCVGHMRDFLADMGIDELKRLGFKVFGFEPQQMGHGELGDLFFGSILTSTDDLASICAGPNDPLIQFNGERDDMKLLLVFSALTADQIAQTLMANIAGMGIGGSRPGDRTIIDFVSDASNQTSLMIDVDLFRENVKATELITFERSAAREAEYLIDAVIAKVLSKERRPNAR